MSEMSAEQKAQLEEQKAQCPFCKIVKGDIPSKKVFEDDLVLAILDINPATKGHVLVLPKEHYPIMPVIPPDTFKHMFKTAKQLCGAIQKGMVSTASTLFIANGYIAGQRSPHFLFHILPRDSGDGLSNFEVPRGKVPKEKVKEITPSLKNNFSIMMRNHLIREGKISGDAAPAGGGMAGRKFTKEDVLKVIEQNPQLKTVLLEKTEQFKAMVPSNPQLQALFKDVDVDEIVEELKKGGK